jgi:hypothetical protein
LKTSENISSLDPEEEEDANDIDTLKQQEGGILSFVDTDEIIEDDDGDQFRINLSSFMNLKFYRVHQLF